MVKSLLLMVRRRLDVLLNNDPCLPLPPRDQPDRAATRVDRGGGGGEPDGGGGNGVRYFRL